jgi:hypothetical protein
VVAELRPVLEGASLAEDLANRCLRVEVERRKGF